MMLRLPGEHSVCEKEQICGESGEKQWKERVILPSDWGGDGPFGLCGQSARVLGPLSTVHPGLHIRHPAGGPPARHRTGGLPAAGGTEKISGKEN